MTNISIKFVTTPNEVYKFNEGRVCKLCGAALLLDKDCFSWEDQIYNIFAVCSNISEHYQINYEWKDPKKISVIDHFFCFEEDDARYCLKIAFNNNGIVNEFTLHNKITNKTETFLMSGKMFHIPKKFNEEKLLNQIKVIWAFR